MVGQATLADDMTLHTFLWQQSVITDLGVLPSDLISGAFGLNDRGQVVGGSCDQNFNCRAFLWQNGVMIDLNTLVKPGSTPLHLVFGNDINSQGEIAALGFDQGTGDMGSSGQRREEVDHRRSAAQLSSATGQRHQRWLLSPAASASALNCAFAQSP